MMLGGISCLKRGSPAGIMRSYSAIDYGAAIFAEDRTLLGKEIQMSGELYTVVGILPPGIHDRFNSQLWYRW